MYVYDIEVFPNFLLFNFYNPENKTHISFPYFDIKNNCDIRDFERFVDSINSNQDTLVSFNGSSYDRNVIQVFLQEHTISSAYNISKEIIENKKYLFHNPFRFTKEYDIFKLLPRGVGGLKKLEAKFQYPVIECKLDFSKDLTKGDVEGVIKYCQADCEFTAKLFEEKEVQDRIKIRTFLVDKYQLFEFNRSEAQIGGDVIINHIRKKLRLTKRTEIKPLILNILDFTLADIIDKRITKFNNPEFEKLRQNLLTHHISYKKVFDQTKNEMEFVNSNPISYLVPFHKAQFAIGEGGLHMHGNIGIFKGNILNVDVQSMYPNIIRNLRISPNTYNEKFTSNFNEIFSELLDGRMKAKADGDSTAAKAMKIPLNAISGLFKSVFSPIAEPSCHLKIALNGQLYMLKLIEKLDFAGFKILHVNTDGILLDLENTSPEKLNKIFEDWEYEFNLKLDKENMDCALIHDTNNYMFIKDKKIKKVVGKILNTELNIIDGGTDPYIIGKMIFNLIVHKEKFEDTITKTIEDKDIMAFSYIRSVKTPIEKRGIYRYHLTYTGDSAITPAVATYGSKVTYTNETHLKDVNCEGINIEVYLNKARKVLATLDGTAERELNHKIDNQGHKKRMREFIKLRDLGLNVIPIAENSKIPIIPWGELKYKLSTKKQTKEWFSTERKINGAIICGKVSGIMVVDIDDINEVNIDVSNIPKNFPVVKTSRGLHIYFKYSGEESRRVSNCVEIKSDGRIVIVPPSISASGVEYEWINHISQNIDNLPTYPSGFIIEEKNSTKSKKSGNQTPLEYVTEGGRNEALFNNLFWNLNANSNREYILKYAERENKKFSEPLSHSEVLGIVKSIDKIFEDKIKCQN